LDCDILIAKLPKECNRDKDKNTWPYFRTIEGSKDKKFNKGEWKSIVKTGEIKHAIKELKFEDITLDANFTFNVDLRKQFHMRFVSLNLRFISQGHSELFLCF